MNFFFFQDQKEQDSDTFRFKTQNNLQAGQPRAVLPDEALPLHKYLLCLSTQPLSLAVYSVYHWLVHQFYF